MIDTFHFIVLCLNRFHCSGYQRYRLLDTDALDHRLPWKWFVTWLPADTCPWSLISSWSCSFCGQWCGTPPYWDFWYQKQTSNITSWHQEQKYSGEKKWPLCHCRFWTSSQIHQVSIRLFDIYNSLDLFLSCFRVKLMPGLNSVQKEIRNMLP